MKCSLWQANRELLDHKMVLGSNKNLECKYLDSEAVKLHATTINNKNDLQSFKYHYRLKG